MPSLYHMLNCVKQFLISFVNGNFILFIFLEISKMPSWCHMLNCVKQFLISFANGNFILFIFLAVSKMPSWCHMLNCVKQFLLSFVKYHTYFGYNLRKKYEKKQRKIKRSSNIQTNVKIF